MEVQKKIVWNASNVAFFWNSYSRNPKNSHAWMSEGSGKAIAKEMRNILPRGFLSDQKSICDWGCGTGSFAKALATQGHRVYGFDQVEVVSQISSGAESFIGVSNSNVIKNQELDLVYALEVIEHIIDSEIDKSFAEWRRILKKDGFLLFTTPNEEDLQSNSIICPNCETQFHSVQHVRSLSKLSISEMVGLQGFKVERVWLGEFFFATKRGHIIESLRKVWFIIRKIQARKAGNSKPPHMMVLCKLK
jgi:2-polyprenyl-3-methyl-5-hydroxy-6-metoxy-1,4-benzoquinol methylase